MKKLSLGLMALLTAALTADAMAGTAGCDFDCVPTTVPEPGTLGLMAAGIAAAIAVRVVKKRK